MIKMNLQLFASGSGKFKNINSMRSGGRTRAAKRYESKSDDWMDFLF